MRMWSQNSKRAQMNQQSKFKVGIAVAIVTAFLLFFIGQLTWPYLVQWALESTNEISTTGSL